MTLPLRAAVVVKSANFFSRLLLSFIRRDYFHFVSFFLFCIGVLEMGLVMGRGISFYQAP